MAAAHCSGGMRLLGRIFDAWTMADVSPASRSSCRNALFSTTRAAGLSPKLMLLRPTVVWQFGSRREISRVPSIVSSPFRRSSSMPVVIGRTSGSNIRSCSRTPYLAEMSRIRVAMSTFRSRVRAMAFSLSSSIVPATTAAPYFTASRQMSASFSSPSSKFIEFRMHRPGASFSPASSTAGLVLSSMSGTFTLFTYRRTTSLMSRTPSRPTKSTHTSNTWLPSRTSSRAMLTRPSQSSAWSSRLNCRLPLVFVRSATIKYDRSWRMSSAVISDDTCGLTANDRPFAFRPTPPGPRSTASHSMARCSGIVPQHPPMMFTPNSSTNRIMPRVKSVGTIGKIVFPSTMTGMPAFGRALTIRGKCSAMYRTVSVSSGGPNAQLTPSTATSAIGSNAATRADSSLPVSIDTPPFLPLLSNDPCTMIGSRRPASAKATFAAAIAHLMHNRSCWVSTSSTSAPPASRPRTCSA